MIQDLKQFYLSLCNALVSWIPPDNFISDAYLDSILLIRLDELGDFILWLDSAKEYRRIYPDRRITLLVNEKWYDLAKTFDYWDEVIGMNTFKFRFNPFYRLKFLVFIRKQGFRTVLCPRYTVQFLLEPAIVATSGAEEKIIFQGNFPTEKQNYWTRMIKSSFHEMHELKRNAEFIVGLGYYRFKSSVPKLDIKKKKGNYILICPTAYRKHKEWPLEKFVELMQKLYNRKTTSLVMASNVKIKYNFPPHVTDYSNNKDLMKFIYLIANANLVISNDSSAIHIASALDVPSVCIGSGKYTTRFVPYPPEFAEGGRILPKGIFYTNVKEISVNSVWEIVRRLT